MSNCDRCGKASVYHSTLIVNGVSQTTNLCRDCAIKEGVFSTEPASIFEDMFAPFGDMLAFEEVADVVCPVCKTSLREFKTTHRLGCPNCYETFNEEIGKLLKKIAPYENHKQQKLNNYIKENSAKTSSNAEKIVSLREEMAKAVSEERYEDAAKLKKKIQKLESENE